MALSERLPEFLRARLAGRATLAQAVDNSFWLFCDQLLRMGAALVVGVWVARYLGPESFGWLNYALAAVGIVGAFTSLGLNAVVVREMARAPADAGAWIGAALFLRSAGAAVGFLACVVLAWLNPGTGGEERTLILVVAAGMIAQVPDVLDLAFQSRGESCVSAWIRMAACAIANALKVALILMHAPVVAFAAAGVAELSLASLGWLLAARQQGWRTSDWRCDRSRLSALLRESWPLAISGLAIHAQAYADQLVIGSFLGGAELGQYAAAMRIVVAFGFVPMVVQTVAAPEIARAHRDDETLYLRRLHGLYRLMFILFVGTAIPLIALGPLAVSVLFGASYAGAGLLLPWLAFRLFFTNFGVARSVFLTNEGMFRFGLLTACAGAVVNLLLNVILVPQWGARGAIVASFVSFGATTFAFEALQPRARMNLGLMARAIFQPWRRFGS